MNVESRRLSDIIPYAGNAKKHNKRQIANVAESIRQYGFVQPIVVDRDGVIVIGHCRALAAKKLGMEEVPCVCVDDLTPEQVDALRLVDNKSNESEWDFDLLAEQIPQLDLTGFDFNWGIENADDYGTDFSFADGCSCGDGAIYRASGFVLTAIKPNGNLVQLQSGEKIHKMTLESNPTSPRKELGGKCYYDITGGNFNFKKYVAYVGGEILSGYQLRYIYFIDPAYRQRLTVPIIPFSKIDEVGAGMYKGEKISQAERHG